jgi:hypothetical protein
MEGIMKASRSTIGSLFSLGVVLAAAFTSGCGEGASGDAVQESALTVGTALFVVGNTALSAADSAVQQRLTALGFSVTVRQDAASTSADATGKQLVVISSTVGSAAVGTKFKSVAVPVLVWEPNLYQDMGMTGTTPGTVGAQTQLAMVAGSSDPMAAGLSGTQTVTSAASTFSWGRPGTGAFVVSRTAGSSTQVAIYRYEKGAAMSGLTAPERRVGFFLSDTTATALNTAGRSLVDAAIRWAAHLSAPLGAACTSASGCASGFCQSGVCCASACTGSCMACNLPGSMGTCSAQPGGTTCAAATCASSTFTPARTCDSAGTCGAASPTSCGPYTCGVNAACRSSCSVDADCLAPNRCLGGLCARAQNGAACSSAAGCASGFCVSGVCCNTVCTGTCSACNNAGSVGTCSPEPAGRVCAPASCSGSVFTAAATCDGRGECQAPTANSCAPFTCSAGACATGCNADADCVAGAHCTNGVCS